MSECGPSYLLFAVSHDGLGVPRQLQHAGRGGQLGSGRVDSLLRLPAALVGRPPRGEDTPTLPQHLAHHCRHADECKYSDICTAWAWELTVLGSWALSFL